MAGRGGVGWEGGCGKGVSVGVEKEVVCVTGCVCDYVEGCTLRCICDWMPRLSGVEVFR